TQEQATETAVEPAGPLSYSEFEIKDIPAESFDFLNENGAEITLENGGRIRISPNSLVNEQGEVIKGEVQLSFKEYHSLVDILVSGLPMKYDSAGVSYDFQSAGMFTIGATQNNNELNIKEGAEIEVDLANYQDTKCYNFYALNEETENWEYLKSDSSKAQPKEDNLVLDVGLEMEYSHIESLNNQLVIAWKVLDEINPLEAELIRPKYVEEEAGDYYIHTNHPKYKKVKVAPVFLSEMEAEEGVNTNLLYAYKTKSKTFRGASINRFGTYNWDKIIKVPEYFASVSTLAFPQYAPQDYRVKLLVYDRNAVFERQASNKTSLPLYLDSKMLLMAISKYGDVSIIGAKDLAAFRKGEISELPAFTSLKGKFKSNRDLEKIMQDYI
ncbi:hypothetical protein, partial [Lishizhenia sp.]|uniref:hypothetical protein n=1 Tax=Lishizhenia sp. TaxID=2497594 RepID=UPI00299F3C67